MIVGWNKTEILTKDQMKKKFSSILVCYNDIRHLLGTVEYFLLSSEVLCIAFCCVLIGFCIVPTNT